MTTPIHPEAVKAYRERKRWGQKQLADATLGRDKVLIRPTTV